MKNNVVVMVVLCDRKLVLLVVLKRLFEVLLLKDVFMLVFLLCCISISLMMVRVDSNWMINIRFVKNCILNILLKFDDVLFFWLGVGKI